MEINWMAKLLKIGAFILMMPIALSIDAIDNANAIELEPFSFYISPIYGEGEDIGLCFWGCEVRISTIEEPNDYFTLYDQIESGEYCGMFEVETPVLTSELGIDKFDQIYIFVVPDDNNFLVSPGQTIEVIDQNLNTIYTACLYCEDDGNEFTLGHFYMDTYFDQSEGYTFSWNDNFFANDAIPIFSFGNYETIKLKYLITAHCNTDDYDDSGELFCASELYCITLGYDFNWKNRYSNPPIWVPAYRATYNDATSENDNNPMFVTTENTPGYKPEQHFDPIISTTVHKDDYNNCLKQFTLVATMSSYVDYPEASNDRSAEKVIFIDYPLQS